MYRILRNNTFDQNDTYYHSIVKVIFHHMIIQHFNMTIKKRMKPQWIHHTLAEVDTEKNQALSNLESNEISTIEQQIENCKMNR